MLVHYLLMFTYYTYLGSVIFMFYIYVPHALPVQIHVSVTTMGFTTTVVTPANKDTPSAK